MTWRVVARLMALDARRSRGWQAVVVVFAAVGIAAVLVPAAVFDTQLSADRAVVFLVAPLKLLVALTALLSGYGAIAAPRAGGQLKLVLGLPIDRTALVVGAFMGRTAVVLGGLAVGLGVVAVAVPLVYGSLPLRAFGGFAALLALFGVAMSAIAVGLSAVTASRTRAATAAVGAFVLFEFFWAVVPAGAHYLATGSLPGSVVPAWVVLLERLQPFAAFEAATDGVLPSFRQGVQLSGAGAEAADSAAQTALSDRIDGPVPRYLEPWVGVVTLLAWTLGALAVGLVRFRHTDL